MTGNTVTLRWESVANIACLTAILITFWLHLGKRGSKLHPFCNRHNLQNTTEFIRNRSASAMVARETSNLEAAGSSPAWS